MKKSVGSTRLDLAQYREMQAFSQFGGDLDSNTLRQLRYGAGLMHLLKQSNNSPMSLHKQIITLICAQAKLFTDIPTSEIKDVQRELLEFFEQSHSAICLKIEHDRMYSEKIKNEIIDVAKRFFESTK